MAPIQKKKKRIRNLNKLREIVAPVVVRMLRCAVGGTPALLHGGRARRTTAPRATQHASRAARRAHTAAITAARAPLAPL